MHNDNSSAHSFQNIGDFVLRRNFVGNGSEVFGLFGARGNHWGYNNYAAFSEPFMVPIGEPHVSLFHGVFPVEDIGCAALPNSGGFTRVRKVNIDGDSFTRSGDRAPNERGSPYIWSLVSLKKRSSVSERLVSGVRSMYGRIGGFPHFAPLESGKR